MLSISSPAISEQAGFYAGGALTAMAIAYLIQGTQTGAGIGSGDSGTVNSIQIDNCVVLATGGRCGAGIGGGDEGNFGTININNSNVYAEGGDYGAGIGTGDEANDGGTINIKKSTVTAKAGTDAAGIGGGNECKVNSINIEDSTITAHGGSYAAGIGGGDTEDGGNITIDFSDVKAYAGKDGAGIGGGEDGDGGTIEIYSSTVYSEGKGDGAGIGNGEDGNESDITIWGEDTSVKAWGGSGGGKAIGFSDNGWFHNQTSYTTFGKNIRAKAGSNENSTNYYTGSSIHKAVRSNRFAYIYSCPHDNIGWHYYDEYYHNKYCIDCGKEFTTYKDKELHTYNSDHKCTVCGSADLETEITVVEKNKNGSQVTRTINSPMHDSYVLPECENVPDGYEFVCWCIRTGGSFEVPGNSISLYPYEKMKITAIYLPVVETQYLDADGEIKTVKARVIDSWENISKAHSVIGNYLLLTEGWYVVNKDIITKYNFRYFHNVNVIIADGKTLSFTEPRWNARIEEISAFYPDRLLGQDENYISIYGQSEQSGVLDIRGRGMIIHNLRINSCEVLFDGEDDWIDFTKPGKENCVINGGRINGGEVAAGILEIYGGNVNLKTANYSEIHLGWKELSDRIKIDDLSCTVSPFANIITIKDGQALVDESGNIYEGTLTETQKTAMQGRTLTPYLKHNYSEPQWEWLDDSKSANAVFTCQDSGCGDEQVIPAEVTYEDKDNLRNSTAVCEFNGKTYTATHTTKLLWDVKIQNNAHGAITADKGKAKARDEISLDFTPNNGYLLKSWSVTPDDGEQSVKTKSTQFVMPECDVTVSAEFVPITPKTEPYIDQNGEYHLGIAEHVEIDGEPYSVNEDGTIGEYLDSIELSYFDFALINNDSEYQIKYYTGPTDISELVIPKTFNGKPVTVLGVDNNDTFINYGENSKTQFDLVLNENIREIKNRSFYTMWVKKVTGDTSGLKIIGAYAFSWANSPDGYKLDIKLDYEGEIDVDTKIFNNMNVTMRLKHATTFDSNSFGQQSISYIFADAHSYGEPVWKWSSDNSSATATFTCTNSRCKHTETVDATVTVDNQRDKKIYTATAQLDGETCSDTKTVNKTLSSINVAATEHGTVTADKAEAYEGEEVKLTITPDTGYKLSTLTVIDENNQELNITDGSFTMPDCAVNVSATFEQKSCSITYAETDCGWIHGAYSANYDDEIELNITPASGYEIDTLTVTDDNENVIPVTDNKFSMPDSDVTVSATFKKSDLNITYGPFEHGTITGAATAQFNDHVPLTIIPDEGYAAMNVYAEDDGWGELAYIIDNELYMLDGDVTVYAEFVPVTPAQEPYIDENGEYHLGNIEHCEIDGYYFAVENGIVGSSLDSVEVSYFDFTDNGDSYQINYYTGPTENLTELVIPKTYKNKPITILGTDNQSAFIANANPKTQFTLTLNDNIQEIKGYSFYTMWVKKVQGDTSNLKRIGDYAFSWANSPDGYKLDIKLDYEGTIMVGRGIFNNMTVTARVHHATGFSYGSFMQKSLTYVITDDAHSYGNPTWDWDDDYSTATAKFTCADSRCKHEETVDAAITSEYENGAPKYTATALFENKTYTDVNALSNLLDASYYPSITAAGARDSDGNQFNLPNDLIYKKATLLGVQKKEAIKTDTAGTGMRFVAEISSEYFNNDDVDYGFEIVKTTKKSTSEFNAEGGFGIMQNLIDSNSSNIKTVSCKGTSNTIVGKGYGDDSADTTYKYVTLSVYDIPDTQGIAVRFYVEIDGVRYYSSYTNSTGDTFRGCCASCETLVNAVG